MQLFRRIRFNRRIAYALCAGFCFLSVRATADEAPGGPANAPGDVSPTDKAASPKVSTDSSSAPPRKADNLGELSLEELMTVEVATVSAASKKEEKASAAPGTVLVIDAHDIKLRGYSNLKDVLRDLPGMEAIEYYFSEIGTQVPVRGIAGNNKIVVLVNGMRVNPPGGEFLPLRSDFSVRGAEKIEVIYGPGSTLYGQDAISAVINIKTKRPEGKKMLEGGGLGGVNATREAWVLGGTRFGKQKQNSVAAYVQYHDSNLTQLDKEYPTWWADYLAVAAPKGDGLQPARQDYGLNGFARWEGRNMSAQVWQRRSRRSSSEGFSALPPILGYIDEARWGDESTVGEVRHNAKISRKVNLDSALSFNRYEIDPRTRYVFPASNTQWFLNDFKYGRGKSTTLEENLRVNFNSRLSLLAGLSSARYDIIPKSTIPGGVDFSRDLVTQGGSFVYFTRPNDPTSRVEIPRVVRVKYHDTGAFAELGWQASRSLKAIFGARVDKDSRFGNVPFSPRVAAIYDINQRLKLKYVFTKAYVQPAPYFGFATFDNGTLLATSNPNLQPESATSNEVNLAYAKKNLNLGLSVYAGDQSNLLLIADRGLTQNIIPNPDLANPADGTVFLDLAGTQTRTLVRTVNGGTSRNRGADLYGQMSFGRVSMWASYSYVDFEQKAGVSVFGLPGISRHNLRLGSTYAATPRLFLTPSLILRSTPENVAPGRLASELKMPYEINLHIGYRATDKTEIFADLRNLTNHKYALGGITGLANPQETRRGEIGVRYSF